MRRRQLVQLANSARRSVRHRTDRPGDFAYSAYVLYEFLTANRGELIERCRVKNDERRPPQETAVQLAHGVPTFLDQLIKTLQVEQTAERVQSVKVSGISGGGSGSSEIGASATLHGRELSQQGFTFEQVVHEYGDLCQAISDLALERDASISVEEFRTLNRCLDNGIADAVSEFGAQRVALVQVAAAGALNERLGFLAHELRNHVHTATLAMMAMKAGHVGLTGATSGVLDRSLSGMRALIDRTLADVRSEAGLAPRARLISLADFFCRSQDHRSAGGPIARMQFHGRASRPALAINVDREMLFSAVRNLLQNAFKFTRLGTDVALTSHVSADRIRIDVSDHCGGLPDATPEDLFVTFKQSAKDRTGLGLGLAISRRAVETNHGTLAVRDIPGTGCVFSIDLPRHALPQAQ